MAAVCVLLSAVFSFCTNAIEGDAQVTAVDNATNTPITLTAISRLVDRKVSEFFIPCATSPVVVTLTFDSPHLVCHFGFDTWYLTEVDYEVTAFMQGTQVAQCAGAAGRNQGGLNEEVICNPYIMSDEVRFLFTKRSGCWSNKYGIRNVKVSSPAATLAPIPIEPTPSQAPTVEEWCAVKILHAAGSQTCVRNFDDTLRCWGRNHDCRLGIGDNTNRGTIAGTMGKHLPFIDAKASNGDTTISDFTQGNNGACFTTLNETKCWGNGASGYHGGETKANVGCTLDQMGASLAALPVPFGCSVLQLVMANRVSCLLCNDRISVYCWGDGTYGALGSGNSASRGGTVGWGSSWPKTDLGGVLIERIV
eukprot:Hpha_TRINITY_DN2214_c0_g1::TRINITY_DN2214_c0_g1_i1::g.25411::m.25411